MKSNLILLWQAKQANLNDEFFCIKDSVYTEEMLNSLDAPLNRF